MGLDPQIAAQLLGTLIQSAATFLAVYLGIVIFIVQDKILAPFFLRHWQVWGSFGVSCIFWVGTIAYCVFDFMSLNLSTQFSSDQLLHEIVGFFLALAFSLITFAVILGDRRRLEKR